MQTNNDQIRDLLDEFKTINKKAKNYLDELNLKIIELDLKYAQQMVQNDINVLKTAKSVLQSKGK